MKTKMGYCLSGGLSKTQLETMHEQALEVLQNIGLEIPHEQIRDCITDFDGICLKNDRVCFEPDLINNSIKGISYPEGEAFEVLSGAYSMNILDPETNQIRQPTVKDLVETTKLADSLGMSIIAPVTPHDVPLEVQQIRMFKEVWENSARGIGGGVVTTTRQAEYVYDMAQAADKRFSLALWAISPLKLDANCLDIIWNFRNRNVETWVATMPMAGSTSPIFMIGSYVQSIAETLGAVATLKLISDGGNVTYGFKDSFRAYPFDMKYGSIAYGSAEYVLMTLIQMQIAEFYGLPKVVKSLITTSKQPDAHAAAEKMGHTMAAVLAGADSYSNAGMLSIDEVYSPAQAVIDKEILNYAQRVRNGYDFNSEALGTDIIGEVIDSGRTFMEHESTLANYRETLWTPDVFEHRTLSQWKQEGMNTVIDKASEIVKKKIAQHDFALPQNVRKELDKIYRKAEANLL